jgi:hypothetical protein
MRKNWDHIFGSEVIDRAGSSWGLDQEGELIGAYRPTGQPGVRSYLRTSNQSNFNSVMVRDWRFRSFPMVIEAAGELLHDWKNETLLIADTF